MIMKRLATAALTTALLLPVGAEAGQMMVKAPVNINQVNQTPRVKIPRPVIKPVSAAQTAKRVKAVNEQMRENGVAGDLPPLQLTQAQDAPDGSDAPLPRPRPENRDVPHIAGGTGIIAPPELTGPDTGNLLDAMLAREASEFAEMAGLKPDMSAFAPDGFDDPLDRGTDNKPEDRFAGLGRAPWMPGGSNEPDVLGLMPDMGSNGKDTPTGEFTRSVVGTPEEMFASAKGGLASQDGSDKVHVHIDLGEGASLDSVEGSDGVYRQTVFVPHEDGGSMTRTTETHPDGFSIVRVIERDSGGRVTEDRAEYNFHHALDRTMTGEENTGGGVLPPNCGSAACNALRKYLADPEGSLRAQFERGTRVNPGTAEGTQQAPTSHRFVSEYDLVSQPDPYAMQGGGGGNGARFHDGGKLINPPDPNGN